MERDITDFIDYAWRWVGKPYIWGGDDPSGFDCSGLVVECLKGVGILKEPEDLTANGLMRRFNKVVAPTEGCLAFRIDNAGHAEHVVICIGNGLYIGADGGGSGTTSDAAAWKANAFVKMRPLSKYDPKHLVFADPFAEVG